MSNRDQIEAVVRETYARRCAGDVDGLMAMFGPEPRFRLAGDEILGDLTVEVRGRKDLRAILERLMDAWDWSDYRIDTVVVEGNRAVVHSKGTMFYVPKKQSFVTQTLDLMTIDDSKIADFLQFCDTHMAARAMDLPPV